MKTQPEPGSPPSLVETTQPYYLNVKFRVQLLHQCFPHLQDLTEHQTSDVNERVHCNSTP
jgi:hypothetical protein